MENFISRDVRQQALIQAREMLRQNQTVTDLKLGNTNMSLQLEKGGLSLVIDSFEVDGKTFYLGTKT